MAFYGPLHQLKVNGFMLEDAPATEVPDPSQQRLSPEYLKLLDSKEVQGSVVLDGVKGKWQRDVDTVTVHLDNGANYIDTGEQKTRGDLITASRDRSGGILVRISSDAINTDIEIQTDRKGFYQSKSVTQTNSRLPILSPLFKDENGDTVPPAGNGYVGTSTQRDDYDKGRITQRVETFSGSNADSTIQYDSRSTTSYGEHGKVIGQITDENTNSSKYHYSESIHKEVDATNKTTGTKTTVRDGTTTNEVWRDGGWVNPDAPTPVQQAPAIKNDSDTASAARTNMRRNAALKV